MTRVGVRPEPGAVRGAGRARAPSYTYDGVLAPLLVWYRIHESEVVCMLQEFLHVRYPHVPGATVWYWQLLPYYTNLNNLGRNFDLYDLLPSLQQLVRFAAKHKGPVVIDFNRIQQRGRRTAGELAIEYGPGTFAMWLGEHVFFYRESTASDDPTPELCNVTTPQNHTELPRWVLEYLCEISPGLDAFAIERNVDAFLSQFGRATTPAQRMLRAVNWPTIPLVWNPTFVKNVETHVSTEQALQAQARLIKGVCPSWEDAERLAETIDLLNVITGIASK